MGEKSVRNGSGSGVRGRKLKLTASVAGYCQGNWSTLRLSDQIRRSASAMAEVGNLNRDSVGFRKTLKL